MFEKFKKVENQNVEVVEGEVEGANVPAEAPAKKGKLKKVIKAAAVVAGVSLIYKAGKKAGRNEVYDTLEDVDVSEEETEEVVVDEN